MSLERDLLDAEPMKELSGKRPLVCSEVNGQIILLKVSSLDLWEILKYKGGVVVVLFRKVKTHCLFSKLCELTGMMIMLPVWLPELILNLKFLSFP